MKHNSMKQFYVAVDIECVSHDKVNGIGLFCGDSEGNIIFKDEWWIEFTKDEVDPRCLKEFWLGCVPEVFEHAMANGKKEEDQIKSFVKEFDSLHTKAGVEEWDMTLISDNPEYDFGRLTNYVKKYCNREPLRYTTKSNPNKYKPEDSSQISKEGEYRSITSLDDSLWPLGIDVLISEAAYEIQAADHRPMNDAHNMYVQHLITLDIFKEIRQAEGACDVYSIAESSSAKVVGMLKRKKQKVDE